MKRPQLLPPLQFQIIKIIGTDEKAGRDIRDSLRKQGMTQTLASFYMLVKRMKDAGLLSQRFDQTVVDGFAAKQACYRVTGTGSREFNVTRDWYEDGPSFETVRPGALGIVGVD